jgi:hypothetical protein
VILFTHIKKYHLCLEFARPDLIIGISTVLLVDARGRFLPVSALPSPDEITLQADLKTFFEANHDAENY